MMKPITLSTRSGFLQISRFSALPDRVVVLAEEKRSEIRLLKRAAEVNVIRMGVDYRYFAPLLTEQEDNSLGFVGNFRQ